MTTISRICNSWKLERAHRSEAELKAERDLADQIVDSMGQGLMLFNDQGDIEYANPAAERIIGQSEEALVGQPAREILQSSDSSILDQLAGNGSTSDSAFDVFIDHDDGQITHVSVSITPHHGGSIVTLNDLTLRKQFETKLERLAHYDALTGLANRTLFIERCERALVQMRRHPSRIAVLFLDLDRFKPINDTMGHAVGDQVLVEVAGRISERIRGEDTVARIGGDEFVVLLTNVDDAEEALEVADRIARRIEEPIIAEGQSHQVSASIGVVISQSPDAKPETLMHYADTAMYEAKNRTDLRRVLYTPAMRSQAPQLTT
ncbi:MAG: diguanylate cyclase [Thermomicrobiales bacterium]